MKVGTRYNVSEPSRFARFSGSAKAGRFGLSKAKRDASPTGLAVERQAPGERGKERQGPGVLSPASVE